MAEINIEKLALLARIKLGTKEKEKLQKEFEAILGYVSKLKEMEVGAISDQEASKTIEIENIVREDENPYASGEFSEDLFKKASSVERGYFKVKRILE
jgi:aspartyl/glutamyl-tRNA(Asn/Gln) amidotransferase C subunit